MTVIMPARIRRTMAKAAIVEALRSAGHPMNVGDLFLVTEQGHSMITLALQELQREGLVASEIRTTRTANHSGCSSERESMHWWLA